MSKSIKKAWTQIEQKIFWIRGQRVMLDHDLALIYGVSTKALNQAVRRNRGRFPEDFMFRLSPKEKQEVVTICDHLRLLKYSPYLPHVFTEHGALMLANVLNSHLAARVSIEVVRAFVRLRQIVGGHADLSRKVAELEKKYDTQFKVVFDAIRSLMIPPEKPKRRIGFQR